MSRSRSICTARVFCSGSGRVGIVNADDPHWEEILKGHTCQVRTFSAEGNDVKDQVVDLFASDIGYINEGGQTRHAFYRERPAWTAR